MHHTFACQIANMNIYAITLCSRYRRQEAPEANEAATPKGIFGSYNDFGVD